MSQYRKIAFLFPGQGAQYPGMAKDFGALARQTLEEADDLLGTKLSSLILHGPENELTETRNSQPALFVACVAALREIRAALPHIAPTVCAGLSLGEYTALYASGRISFATGLTLVQKRGAFMHQVCETTSGTMAAILGLGAEAVEKMVKELHMPDDLWVANYNCPGQVVISGTKKGIDAAAIAAKAYGAKRIIPLQVHGAFHSGLMRPAEERFAPYIENAPLIDSDVGLVMNVPGNFVTSLDAVRANLIQQISHSVHWEQGIRHMGDAGVDLFVEIGLEKKTLADFNKRILSVPTLNVGSIKTLEEFAKAVT